MICGVALVAVAGLGWLLWTATALSSPPVSAQLRGFAIESEHLTSVTITVLRRQGDAVRCHVYAQAIDHATVGERSFDIPAGEAGTITVEQDIVTERAAVSGVLRSCEVAGSGG
ncbi:MAG: DUF4307 domain-containing protein [Actinomycetota bacterium]|nr:DUF4307 domain-containing protein [Actinomycetota bacterium]